MFRPVSIRTNPTLSALIGGLFLVFCTAPLAGKNDFEQPILLGSKHQFIDAKAKVSIYREEVHIEQGSLSIDADEVEVNAAGGKGNEIFIARGNPARYQQSLDDGGTVKASAREIHYDVATRTLNLSGDAQLQQDSSMVKAQTIIFNMELEQLQAEGEENGDGRVLTIFQPDDKKAKKGGR